jgi:yecA family protein
MPGTGAQFEFGPGPEDLEPADASDRYFEGYMTAIAVCPVDVPMAEVLENIFAEDAAVEKADGIASVELALSRLREVMTLDPEGYHPLFIDAGEDRRPQAIDWAIGFVSGIRVRHEIWSKRMRDPVYWDAVAPIFEVASLHPEFFTVFPSPVPVEPLGDAEIEDASTGPPAVSSIFSSSVPVPGLNAVNP